MTRPHDLRPASAVSTGVGIAGIVGLGAWVCIARLYGMDGPNAGLAAVAACALPMVLWSLLVDKVHRRASTGIDWSNPRLLRDSFETSSIKLVGLWATWALIALFYMSAGWYWDGAYRSVMSLLTGAAPWVVALSLFYLPWLDRYLVDPRDGAYAFGQWIVGGPDRPTLRALADHARAWGVKAFFLAFMLSIVPGNFTEMVHWKGADLTTDPVALANFLISLMFVVDVAFATVGYMLTLRPLDAHIRAANPYLEGWVAALICYPPFVLMGPGGPLHYATDTADWAYWLEGRQALLWLWGGMLVVLTGIYAWATVAFGLRFSNLTHRGIITHGPYRLTRHPAYVAKNAFWWLSTLPFLVTTGSASMGLRNAILLALVSAVYYWRAQTEEKHLSADPDYQAYAAWSERHAPITRLFAWARAGRAPRPEMAAAE